MATERQRRANRANAARSTGPKSPAGKRRSSQNARRHGLSTPPQASDILRWYRIIVGDKTAEIPFLAQPGGQVRAAMELAVAEARLARARAQEEECLQRIVDVFQKQGQFDRHGLEEDHLDIDDESAIDMLLEGLREEGDREFLAIVKMLKYGNPNRPKALLQRLRTIRGYLRRAETARTRALEAWIDSAERSQIQS